MSDNYSHIDNLLKDRLGHDRREGTPDQRAAFMKKAASHRFWNFYPAAFNVYYLALIVFLLGGIVIISTTVVKDKTAIYDPVNTVRDLPELAEPQEASLPLVINRKDAEKKRDVSGEESAPVHVKSDNLSSSKSEPDSEQQKNILTKTEELDDDADYDSTATKVQGELTEPLPVVYDTVVRETRVEVTDTMKTDVKHTIEVKNEKKKRRRR